MTLVGSLGRLFFVCLQTDLEMLGSIPLGDKLVLQADGLYLYNINLTQETIKLLKNLSRLPHFKLRRYLDRFYLLVPDDDSEKRQLILDKFFLLIGDEYESLIDVPRNIENIKNLLRFLSRLVKLPKGTTIVDYGCGTGLSLGPASEQDINLVGVDRCPIMCRIARSRGMIVWNFEELTQQLVDHIMGAFASYVFHLLPQIDGLRLLWTHIKSGGVLVANFHKNQGIEIVDNCIRELGGIARPLKYPVGSERHGAYVAYFKN